MFKKSMYILAAYLAAFFLQTSWFGYLPFWGISINFILCALVVLNCHSSSGLIFACAVVFGLLLDLCLGKYVGISAISYFVVCIVLIVTAETIDKSHFLSSVYTILWATVLFEMVYWSLLFILGQHHNFMYMLSRLPALLLVNTIVAGVAKEIKG